MKKIMLAVLLLSVSSAKAQAIDAGPSSDKKADAFYELTEEARAFKSVSDTAKFTADAVLAKGTKVFVTSYPSPHWAACTRAGDKYVIPVAALGTYEILELGSSSEAVQGGRSGRIYTGPRGGLYRMNSKGNKTYIKHK